MVGVLLITHGALGEAMLANAVHVLGGMQPNVVAMGIAASDRIDDRLGEARSVAKAIDDGSGVLVLTDIFGATPANIAGCLLDGPLREGVAGVSLPMLVKALAYRHLPLGDVAAKAIEGGCNGQIRIKEDCCHAAQGGG